MIPHILTMGLDKFGRCSNIKNTQNRIVAQQISSGFSYTSDGNFDIKKLKLSNVQWPTEVNDAATVAYVDTKVQTEMNVFKTGFTVLLDDVNKVISHSQSSIDYLSTKVNESIKVNNNLFSEVNKKVESELASLNTLVQNHIDEFKNAFNVEKRYISAKRRRIVGVHKALDANDVVIKSQFDEALTKKASTVEVNSLASIVVTKDKLDEALARKASNAEVKSLASIVVTKDKLDEVVKELTNNINKIKNKKSTTSEIDQVQLDLINKKLAADSNNK